MTNFNSKEICKSFQMCVYEFDSLSNIWRLNSKKIHGDIRKNGGFMLYNKICENFQSLHLSEPIY